MELLDLLGRRVFRSPRSAASRTAVSALVLVTVLAPAAAAAADDDVMGAHAPEAAVAASARVHYL